MSLYRVEPGTHVPWASALHTRGLSYAAECAQAPSAACGRTHQLHEETARAAALSPLRALPFHSCSGGHLLAAPLLPRWHDAARSGRRGTCMQDKDRSAQRPGLAAMTRPAGCGSIPLLLAPSHGIDSGQGLNCLWPTTGPPLAHSSLGLLWCMLCLQNGTLDHCHPDGAVVENMEQPPRGGWALM